MSSGVYVIECGGRQYVGSARNITARWGLHRHELRHHKHHSRFLQRAWDKYGEDAFTFRVLEECEAGQCVEREQHWIDTLKPAFNMQPRAYSALGYKHTAETRAKMSKIATQRPPLMLGKHHSEATKTKMRQITRSEETRAKMRGRIVSEETRAKMSAAKKGKPRDPAAVEKGAAKLRGRKRPTEVVESQRRRLTGVRHSDERREANRRSHLGQVITPEQRAKISASLKGRPSPRRGATLTPEQRAKISASLRAFNEASRSG